MKLTTYLFIPSLLICAACSNDELMNEDSQNQENSKITAYGSLPQGITTRMACEEQTAAGGGKELAILWGSETGGAESIGVTDGSTKYEFRSTGLSGTSSTAKFECNETISASEGTPFYAVYPAECLYDSSNPNQADLDITFRAAKGSGPFKTILWSKANLAADKTLDFQFNYINSVLKINIKPFDDNESIAPYCTPTTSYTLMQTEINVLADEGLYRSAKLNMATGVVTDKVQTTELPLFSVDFTYAGGKTTLSDCYQSLFPGTFKNFRIAFNLVDGIYTADIVTNYTFDKGKFYYTKALTPKKVGFIIAKTDLIAEGQQKTISLKTILERITGRDKDCGSAERKTLIVDAFGGSILFDIGSYRYPIDSDFEPDGHSEFEQSTVYSNYSTNASILGNWLRTKATSVELVDMSRSRLTKIPDYMFYGCSNTNPSSTGNSALKQLILPDGITTIGAQAFAKSGIQQLMLMHNNASTLTSVAADAFKGIYDSHIAIYLPNINNQSDAEAIRTKLQGEGFTDPKIYYNFQGEGPADFDSNNYDTLDPLT